MENGVHLLNQRNTSGSYEFRTVKGFLLILSKAEGEHITRVAFHSHDLYSLSHVARSSDWDLRDDVHTTSSTALDRVITSKLSLLISFFLIILMNLANC